MKKIFKTFSLILLALALVLVPFAVKPNSSECAKATFDETYSTQNIISENVMYLEYADDVLIGIDKDGYVYRSEDGTVANLANINVQLPLYLPKFASNNNIFDAGINKPIACASNTLVFIGSTDTELRAYYSLDRGKNWSYTVIGEREILSEVSGVTLFNHEYPISLVYGNGKFALMTAYSYGESALGETALEYKYSNIYTSSDGKVWEKSSQEICLDYSFSYSGGYFFRTEYFSSGTDPIVYYSSDCMTWNSFESPVEQVVSGTSYSNPNLTIAHVNNAFYLAGFGDLNSSTTLGSWRKVASVEELTEAYKMVPYNSGAMFLTSNNVIYADLGENDVTNITYLSTGSTGASRYYSIYANTVVENDNYLIVGFNNVYGNYIAESSSDEIYYNRAKFSTYKKATKYVVKFVDYNGNVIASSNVAEGSLAVAPTNPTRDGYTFTGWDYDLTTPITANTTITAQYKRNSVTVSFLDGSQVIKEIEKEYGSILTEDEIPVPTKDGYIFKGWDKATTETITEDTTFIAVFTQNVTLTIKYPVVVGNSGLLNQFYDTEFGAKTFTYLIGDSVKNTEYLTWYNDVLTPWIEDYSTDGVYDYDTKFIGFETEVPETITNDVEVTISYVDLYNVRLEYYSQLRFFVSDDYYYCFVGYLKTEKLVNYGYIFNANDFKRSDINYEIYNTSRGEFYNNLNHFEWLGWDYDTTQPITGDVIIKGQYKMPTINVRMFDAENYMFNEEDQELGFMTIEDYYLTLTSKSEWDKFREGVRLFLLGRWGELGSNIADQIDLEEYMSTTKKYHNEATQILTAFAKIDTDNPDIYGGVFKNGSVNVTSEALSYYSGTANENNMTYWVNPIIFATDIYSLTCTVTYGTALDSAIKTASNIVTFIGDLLSDILGWVLEYWWVVILVVLFIIFREEITVFLKMVLNAIIRFFKWTGEKIKGATKKRNQAKKQAKETKKQYKKKE